MLENAVCGTAADEPAPAWQPLTPADFGIPYKPTFSPREIAEYLGVSVRTVRREIEDGNLRALPIRGSLRIPIDELKAYFLRRQAG
jgi:excisionase family DNA binding protein